MNRALEWISNPQVRAEAERILGEICRRLDWRIRPLVDHLPEEDIQRLLSRMAWIQYKYEGRDALSRLPTPPASESGESP